MTPAAIASLAERLGETAASAVRRALDWCSGRARVAYRAEVSGRFVTVTMIDAAEDEWIYGAFWESDSPDEDVARLASWWSEVCV